MFLYVRAGLQCNVPGFRVKAELRFHFAHHVRTNRQHNDTTALNITTYDEMISRFSGLCLVAVYLIGGFLYQRLIVGAKGMEQFPNYLFWVDVGNLSAVSLTSQYTVSLKAHACMIKFITTTNCALTLQDGCDFVCRSRNRDESRPYRSVATEPVVEQPEERDDQLLPM